MFGSTGLLVFADDFLGTIERLHVLPLLKKQPTGVKKGDVSLFTQRLCQEQTNRGNTHKNITPERHWWSETPQGTFKITSLSVVNNSSCYFVWTLATCWSCVRRRARNNMKEWPDSNVAQPIKWPDKIRTGNLTCPHLPPSAEPGRNRTRGLVQRNVQRV